VIKFLNKIRDKLLLRNRIIQRFINGFIFLFLLFWYLSLYPKLNISSDLMFVRKGELVQMVMIIFLFQTIFNKTLINKLLTIMCILIIGYFVYSYTYFFFDKNDWYKANFGREAIFIQTMMHLVKVLMALIALAFIYLLRPEPRNKLTPDEQ
jgi:hypothetical protein